jgi:hypothetical protein
MKLDTENPPTLSIPAEIKAKLLHDFSKYENGKMLMQLADATITVQGDGEPIGSIGMAVGGTFFVKIGGACWSLDLIDIFSAVYDAVEKT